MKHNNLLPWSLSRANQIGNFDVKLSIIHTCKCNVAITEPDRIIVAYFLIPVIFGKA